MAVSERSDSMKERDQAEYDLETKRVNTELCLNNGLWNRSLTTGDTLEKQGLDPLQLGPVYL
jgi:hypothetical protein